MCDDFLYHHNVLTHHFLFYHYRQNGCGQIASDELDDNKAAKQYQGVGITSTDSLFICQTRCRPPQKRLHSTLL
ncbi:MAG: hypothetical protein ACTFAK_11650 [Candidatus Electronema sp. VV]